METELKFLDKNYIETRIREIKEIRSKEISYNIQSSNNEGSLSVYVKFYKVNKKGDNLTFFGGKQVRLSDHILTNDKANAVYFKQFIIKPDMFLTKQRKEEFIAMLKKAAKSTLRESFMYRLMNLPTDTVKPSHDA